MNKTAIETFDFTWNPIVGCRKGCTFCYARKQAERGMGEYGQHPKGERFKPRLIPDRLDEPLKRKNPARIFAVSMGDMFSPGIKDEWLEQVFLVMSCGLVHRHTFFVLTKWADRMLSASSRTAIEWTPNIWAGVSVTNQADADERIPLLLQVPAAHRFVSVEPMLGPVDFDRLVLCPRCAPGHYEPMTKFIDWAVIGAQTGPGAKPREPEWGQHLVEQCTAAGVPVFVKANHGPWFDGCERRELP